ncbi:putative nucleotidyltransferase [Thermodesulfobium acidiphilum]|uniref:Putative nucleotidyltransferase n=1 Tax=Thermodesulfobium acidiphilum TaxID=1794699 RepID=A0A2R4VYZ9_THEAF|nr:putative nucleotidyltransferase [Thermodesulfobium acidiphilum]
MDIEESIVKIEEFLSKIDEVLLAFIFGSFIENRLTDESDADFAILFSNMPDFKSLNKIKSGITEITDRDTDIVILNSASPIIKMQVLKRGRLLKKVNDSVYNEFFLRTIKEYDDLKIIRRPQEQNILKGRIYVRD